MFQSSLQSHAHLLQAIGCTRKSDSNHLLQARQRDQNHRVLLDAHIAYFSRIYCSHHTLEAGGHSTQQVHRVHHGLVRRSPPPSQTRVLLTIHAAHFGGCRISPLLANRTSLFGTTRTAAFFECFTGTTRASSLYIPVRTTRSSSQGCI